ncbi:E3 ubiquitin-protein ligase TRIM71-like [Saccostrea cucullata]|uniref:E3 ubiquitin-protein ligase TRIM71-like n=1 Tax=Saccostrea cuccullata TaxID=36930 RepID=UPI002ED0B5E9
MATSTSWAQEIITCDLCPKPTQQFCNNCQVSLCVDCVGKHVDKFKSQTHDIVHFTKRKIQLVFPECKFHSSQRCEAHCQECDVHVCLKCILSSHSGHKIVEMQEIFNKKKTEIENEIKETESTIIPKYEKKLKDTEGKISKIKAKFDELEKETEKHRQLWHQEVDTIFNKLGSLIKSMRENYLTHIESYQTKLNNLIPDVVHTVKQTNEILKANRVSEIICHKSKLEKYRNIPADFEDVNIPSLNTKTVQGRELSIDLGEYKAILTQQSRSHLTGETSYSSSKELLKKAKVVATIPTSDKPTYSVACLGADEAWVSGQKRIIKRLNINGSEVDSVIVRGTGRFKDISVTIQGELIYCDSDNETVNIVRHGKTETLIALPNGWCPWGLCCTMSGDILVSMSYDNCLQKVVRYQEGAVKYEINKDEDGMPILSIGAYINYVAENGNGDICVSDSNARNVVVADKSGRVRFRYDGSPAKRRKSLDPLHIATDSMRQIIVADENNDCLHILDQNGQFLMCVDNCGLYQPCGLSLDSTGRLWVGLKGSKDLKVIQYTR